MRSDAANVCELSEVILERAFLVSKIKIIGIKLFQEIACNLSIPLRFFN